jgi:glycosyltransferase involved in cell wall biosynthesis/beta-glucosidase/6-phospho-beta-glucosidase/beta-galactosidase
MADALPGGVAAADADAPLAGFWMAGFEGADHVNADGHAHDPAVATGHLAQAEADYRALAHLGVRSVRESLGWRLTERPRGFDFSRLRHFEAAAERAGVQIVWTLMHYGVPPGVDVFDERFVERFCAFAEAAGREFRRLTPRVPVWNPINEINFLAWAATESRYFGPPRGGTEGAGFPLKRRLARAALRAMDVLRAIDPRARFMHVEPLIHVVAPPDRPDLEARAAQIVQWQWQAWDMLAGRLEPALGGGPHGLDLLGISHYHASQWETGTEARLAWHLRDPRREPLSQLLAAAHRRYERPVLVAETGHFGAGRADWLDDMAAEVARARRRGVPVVGFCLYPAVDRPDWERPHEWHHAGLWDAPPQGGGRGRVLNLPYAQALRRWQAQLPHPTEGNTMRTLIVFSHLRWNFVHQRPQHVMTRLAARYRVLFVEEPLRGNATPYLERYSPAPNVEVLRPRTPVDGVGFDDAQMPQVAALLDEYLDDFGIDDYLVWFYTPMALPLGDGLHPRAVIYDCMDELSAFRNAPRAMIEREAALLARADVVFTGGPSLYEAKRRRHANVHCLPSAVAAEHYAPSARRAPDAEAARLLAAIPAPRLGFFGVIDERFDAELLAAAADARPDWQFVMVGPVVKIDCATLPRRANIHWLGQQPYERLPHFAAAWDVCLLPFALNESTRFISPTKTLEYMAAERPVVSTPVQDVATLYGDAVALAADAPAFIAACERALGETAAERAARVECMRAHVARTTWDRTVSTMLRELERVEAASARPARPRVEAEALADRARGALEALEALVAPAAREARS